MAQFIPNTPHPVDLARRVAVFPAVKKRRHAVANIWFFDSPKNGKRHIITGDLQFMSFVLLEGTLSCLRYEPRPQPAMDMKGPISSSVTAGAYVFRSDGSTEWWDFQHIHHLKQGDGQTQRAMAAAEELGMQYFVRTPGEMRGKVILFDNWLNLCAGINRCRSLLLQRELAFVSDAVRIGSPKIGELLDAGMDRACMFAAIAHGLQSGIVSTDLESRLLGTDSILQSSFE